MADDPTHTYDPDEVLDHRVHGLRDGLDGVRDLMDRLLGEDGCPWDREQSLASLRPYLLEEAHEVLEALDHDDPDEHRRELGDLLFQIVFHAALREREQQFDLDGVVEAIRSKMLRRHPHVFGPDGGAATLTPEQVEANWAQIKVAERQAARARARARLGSSQDPQPDAQIPDPLAGVPASLPAMQRAWRLQNKAAAVGFDWPDVEGPLHKAHEEFDELDEAIEAGDPVAIEEEFGDLLFVLIRLGTKLGIEAEAALRIANRKFERRFGHIMRRCHERNVDPTTAGLEILDEFWDEAKRLERG
ncbi:nucleoside triphosphate pyrophosphohydrolase [Enhygromyxa salina]|uniref:Nucleoside triphosphate pyrophosphohydrolase n=1 Tax=Enhygromyxa salina TaxID=215803 RepID=A0A2S9YQE3_9BACT|nr:nucleoside triphosphate pyrophosphohydrolase [Enhygromyxa salina]PRQ07300.1 Nucleoside triphosphate pyrophosphohydrolase [Enhygromyxa salina]